MEEENRSKKQSEQEKSHKVCARLDHIFENGKGNCIVCGLVDRSVLKPQKLNKSQLEGIAKKLGVKLRLESKPREKFPDEIILPYDLQAVWDFAVNYANKWDMIERGVYKPTLVELDQMRAKKIKIKIDNETGEIVKITPVEKKEEEKETDS